MLNVTAGPIRPVIPSAQPNHRAAIPATVGPARLRGPLPLARLAQRPAGTLRFGLATIDVNGRVADAALFRSLGWTADTPLHIQTCAGLVVVVADEHGVFRLRAPAHVRIPATARHRCHLDLGDRVLLTADPVNGLLVVYPPAVLEGVVGGLLTARLRQEAP